MSPDRVISNLADYGNTSAASIPLALDESVRGWEIRYGCLKPGHCSAKKKKKKKKLGPNAFAHLPSSPPSPPLLLRRFGRVA